MKKKYLFIPKDVSDKAIITKGIKKSELKNRTIALEIGKTVGASVVIFGSYKFIKNVIHVDFRVAKVGTNELAIYQNVDEKEINLFNSIDAFVENQHVNIDRMLELIDQPKPEKEYIFAFRGGYLFHSGFVGEMYQFWLPYMSIYGRLNIFEFEIGYFGIRSESGLSKQIVVNAFPITASVVHRIKITNWFDVTHKLGFGGMLLVNYSDLGESYTSGLFVIRPAIELSFEVVDDIYIVVENSLLIGQDFNESVGVNMQLYYIPNLGVAVGF